MCTEQVVRDQQGTDPLIVRYCCYVPYVGVRRIEKFDSFGGILHSKPKDMAEAHPTSRRDQ